VLSVMTIAVLFWGQSRESTHTWARQNNLVLSDDWFGQYQRNSPLEHRRQDTIGQGRLTSADSRDHNIRIQHDRRRCSGHLSALFETRLTTDRLVTKPSDVVSCVNCSPALGTQFGSNCHFAAITAPTFTSATRSTSTSIA